MKHIAREAGVSVATVDRVVNKRAGVHTRTASQVLRAMQRLGAAEPGPGQHTDDRPLSFDFVLPHGTNTFINLLERSIRDAAHAAMDIGTTARVHRIPGFEPLALADALLRIGCDTDGIAFVAIDHPAVREAVAELERAGTAVVTLLSDLSATGRRAYVGIDNRAAGRTAGYILGRFLRQPQGAVAMLAGSLSYRGHEEREMGFRHILREEYPQLRIIGVSEAHDDVAQTHAKVRDLLAGHDDLVGIYNIGGGSRGVAQALIESGRQREIVFVGHELTEFTRRFLIDGVMDAAINQDARTEAEQAITLLRAAALGNGPSPAPSPMRIEIFLRENLP